MQDFLARFPAPPPKGGLEAPGVLKRTKPVNPGISNSNVVTLDCQAVGEEVRGAAETIFEAFGGYEVTNYVGDGILGTSRDVKVD